MTNSDKLESWMRRYTEGLKPKPQQAQPTQPVQPIQPIQQNTLPSQTPAPTTPINFERAYFLSGQFGKEFLKEYFAKVRYDYGSADALRVLNWDEKKDCIVGSNPFAVTLVNQMLMSQGIRVATQSDLENILKRGLLDLKYHYEDSSLVYMNNEEPNKYLARKINQELVRHGLINYQGNMPSLLPLQALDIVHDPISPYKISFTISNDKLIFAAPILSVSSGFYIDPNRMDDKTGLPIDLYSNSVTVARQLLTASSGLSRFQLGIGLDLYSGKHDLIRSDTNGRIVLVSKEKDMPNIPGGPSVFKVISRI